MGEEGDHPCPSAPLDSGPVSSTGQAFRRNDGVMPGSPSVSSTGRLCAGTTGAVTLTPALSRRGRGGKSPLPRSLFSCVVGSRLPGGRAAGVCGVDGSGLGVRLVPVLLEFFLDSTLGDGELRGGGFFVLSLLYALGPQGLSANGGPGVSVPASLCSGASCSGPSCRGGSF